MLLLARRLLLLWLISIVAPLTSVAQPLLGAREQSQPVLLAASGGGASSSAEAAQQARKQTGGKVLSVNKVGGGYQVRVLTPRGEVRVVFVPSTGG